MGSSRSELLVETITTSNLRRCASCSRCVARFRSEPLFLGLDDARVLLRAPRNRRKRHHHLVGQEMAQMDGNPRQGAKGTEVQLLPYRLIRVAGPRRHQRRLVFDFGDGVPGKQRQRLILVAAEVTLKLGSGHRIHFHTPDRPAPGGIRHRTPRHEARGASGLARVRREVCPVQNKRATFGVSLLSTAGFNRLLPAATAICPCPGCSQA